jgi:tetratricopeptide (TPR) repeat protein
MMVVALSSASALADDTTAHLLAGVRAFQAGRYDEALVELRFVERARDAPADLAFYLGPTLYKLGRHGEALVVFRRSRAAPDTLTLFYEAQTLYQLALYDHAREAFQRAAARGLGPRLDAAARRYIDVIERLHAMSPGPAAIDAYLEAGARLRARGEALLATVYLDEALRLSARGRTHRRDEIVAELALARAQLETP